MSKKPPKVDFNPHPEFKDPQQAEEFENLFQAYWKYVYKYCVGYEEYFTPDKPWCKRNDFKEQLEDEGMTIKVSEGY